jgi:hypothetical protein
VAATAVTKSAWLELSGYTRTCLEVSILSKDTANAVRRKKEWFPPLGIVSGAGTTLQANWKLLCANLENYK